MNKSAHHFEIKDLMTQFVSAFDDITISRYNKDREEVDKIKVRYVYAPKQRVIHALQNKSLHSKLPVVAVSISGVSRDPERIFNKNAGSFSPGKIYDETLNVFLPTVDYIPQPIAWNISVNMSIISKFQTDMDQIISNFAPYTNPYIIISWKVPEVFTTVEQELRSQVEWSGNMAMNYPIETNASVPYRVSADTTFTIKGWLFRDYVNNKGIIHTIDNKFTPIVALEEIENEGEVKPVSLFPQGVGVS